MATNKPADISSKIWASLGDVETPTDAKIETGWQAEVPKAQIENWVQNRQDVFNAHVNERGIAEWDATTDYIANKSYVQGSNGVIYKAVQNTGPSTVVQDPTTDISKTYWDIAFQTPLVSGASIKTVNGENLLGSGNIIISGGGGTVPNATTEVAGVIKIATNSETIEGLDASKAVPPAGVKAFLQADTTKQDSNANLTALSSVVGAANQVPMFTDAGAMVTIPVTPVAQGLLEQTSKASQRSYLEVQPTDSPEFTGIPKVPTPDGTEPSQIVNVEYLDEAIEGVAGQSVITLNSSGSVSLGVVRKALILVDTSSGDITLTLPTNDSLLGVRDITFRKIDSSTNIVTISRSNTDTIETPLYSKTSVAIGEKGGEVSVVSDGEGKWWENSFSPKTIKPINSSVSLSPSAEGMFLIDASLGVVTVTLPASNSAVGIRDLILRRVDNSANRLVIQASGSDKIKFHTHLRAEGYSFLVLMGAGDYWHLRSDGAGGWWPITRCDQSPLGSYRDTAGAIIPPGGYGLSAGTVQAVDYPWLLDYANASGALVAVGSRTPKDGRWSISADNQTIYLPSPGSAFRRSHDSAGTRELGTYQADALQNITGSFSSIYGTLAGAFSAIRSGDGIPFSGNNNSWGSVTFDASRVARTAEETRPENITAYPLIKLI